MNSNEELSPLVLGPLVPFMEDFTTPAWVEAQGIRFTFDAEQGAYFDEARNELYLEPTQTDGTLTPDAYYEVPEPM